MNQEAFVESIGRKCNPQMETLPSQDASAQEKEAGISHNLEKCGKEFEGGHYNAAASVVPRLVPIIETSTVTFKNVLSPLQRPSRKYYCHVCKISFTNKKHKLVHFPRTYECKFCPKVYGRSDNLSKHVKVKHTAEQTR